MSSSDAWRAGDVIAVRHQWRGEVRFAHPAIVVEDAADRLVLYEPAGAVRQASHFDFATGEITPPTPRRRHTTDALIILAAGDAHAVSLFWREGGGPFLCWYIDMQAPPRRAGGGVTTWDQTLDIVAGPDLRWRWKDEDQLARGVALGWMTAQEAASVRAEGERVAARIEARAPPFCEAWPDWRPDPAWPTPALPDDWATPG